MAKNVLWAANNTVSLPPLEPWDFALRFHALDLKKPSSILDGNESTDVFLGGLGVGDLQRLVGREAPGAAAAAAARAVRVPGGVHATRAHPPPRRATRTRTPTPRPRAPCAPPKDPSLKQWRSWFSGVVSGVNIDSTWQISNEAGNVSDKQSE